ncbi:MAG: hypothetical protein II951_11490 [Bacteroidales bacterium]|nr:hypothetical protein [Bacteroidales bacterium]
MRTIVLFFALIVSLASMAQKTHRDSLNARFFEVKAKEMTKKLRLADDQKDKFLAVYRSYNDEMGAAWADNMKLVRDTTDKSAATRAKNALLMQQKALAIRINYVDKFAAVLSDSQLNHFYIFENQMQRDVLDRRNGGHSNRGNGDKWGGHDRKRPMDGRMNGQDNHRFGKDRHANRPDKDKRQSESDKK